MHKVLVKKLLAKICGCEDCKVRSGMTGFMTFSMDNVYCALLSLITAQENSGFYRSGTLTRGFPKRKKSAQWIPHAMESTTIPKLARIMLQYNTKT